MKSTWFKRMVSVILIFTLAIISPMQFVKTEKAEAAAKNVKYIKEFKLFIKKSGRQKDAEDWCKSQKDGDWHVVEGDLNAYGNGYYTDPIGVFLCYTTTEEEKEAVTDIAVMNEKGNYSESAYEAILKEQRDAYKDLVKSLKVQIKGYQENYNHEVKTAIEAHDLLNGYKEDDTGKLLGDLLRELNPEKDEDAEKLTDILLQANGNVVLFIQQELALACESGTRSWLDRMEQVGGYEKFYNKIKSAFNGDDSLAKRNMDAKYKEKATVIADEWDELKGHLDNIKAYEEKSGVASMTDEQLKEWKENNLKTPEGLSYEQESAMATNLAGYTYDGKSLLEFFAQDKSEISGDNLYKLYPMVSCLQAGQFAGIDTTVSLYSLINQAFSATMINDYEKGKLKDTKDDMNAEQKKELAEAQKAVESIIDQQKKDEVRSIYEGVDREVFNGGVAVTSDALEYSKGSETKWSDEFLGSKQWEIQGAVGGFLLVGTAAASILYASCNMILKNRIIDLLNNFHSGDIINGLSYQTNQLLEVHVDIFESENILKQISRAAGEGDRDAKQAINELYKLAKDNSTSGKVLSGLTKGIAVAMILVAVADIVVNAIALYEYYHRDHLPIPKSMVDMSTNKEKETSYVNYKSVRDNDGEPGDLNGMGGKQWLALYQTYDDRAGQPILAPESGFPIKVMYGGTSSEATLSPLHMFGKPNAAQNLTFADGDNGWSYADFNNGTYLFFTRYDGNYVEEADEELVVSDQATDSASGSAVDGSQAGTAISGGFIVLIAGCAVVVFFFVFIAFTGSRRRKK